jgi:hypothetical protein
MIGAVAACALAFAAAGCGDNGDRRAVCGDLVCELDETAGTCAEDCGCGNGIANPGEDCDGTDVGGATCESAVQRGGTLSCNADCTFNVEKCDEYMCGNGLAEPGEECDGSDLAGATCASVGFSGGALGCGASCRFTLDACCHDFCTTPNSSTCVGDSAQTCTMQANGCLALEVMDCAATDDVCDDSSGTATCTCVDRCLAVGAGRCVGDAGQSCAMQANGCLDWQASIDCSTTGQTCAVGPQGVTCASSATGEDCFDPYVITPGANVIAWNATNADYFTSMTGLSCGSTTGTLTGPDIVLVYTATVDGVATYSIAKDEDMRQVVVVTQAACGTITAQSQVSCINDQTATALEGSFPVTPGAKYYFYLRDTTTGSNALPNPLLLDLEQVTCTTIMNTPSALSPANGSTVLASSTGLSFELPYPVQQGVGVITVTGTGGTSRSYDLATNPSGVTFSNGGRTVQIAQAAFNVGETVTVTWSGLVDTICGLPIAPPTWTFTIGTPSCTPGSGGMVGRTVSRIATGVPSTPAFTEQYVVADEAPGGYVYFGGQSALYRIPKAGGPLENIVSEAVIGTAQLGYAMAVVGPKIFTLDTTTVTTTPFLWRLTTSGGVTWNPLGYGRYPIIPGASSRAMFHDNGRFYVLTNETTAGAATEIWSVSDNASSLPTAAVREATLTGLLDCDGIAGDDFYFYLTCNDDNDHIVRVDRTTLQVELITDAIPLNLTKNELYAHDFDGDGRADALYVKSDNEVVNYVCGPGGAGPYWTDVLATFGSATTTANYGLGFDPVANALWAYDDDERELVRIQ